MEIVLEALSRVWKKHPRPGTVGRVSEGRENKELRKDLHELQRQVHRIAGKLEGVSEFVAGAIEDKIDARVEKAEIRAFERLLSMIRGSQREIE